MVSSSRDFPLADPVVSTSPRPPEGSGATPVSAADLDQAYSLLVYCLGCFLQERPLHLAETPWAIAPPWTLMVQLAQSQGVAVLVYKVLSAEPPGTVPEPLMAWFKQSVQGQVAVSMQLIQALSQVLRLFENHGLAVIPYKGPVLAQAIYGDIGLRYFSDLDLWVAPQNCFAARQLLMSQGGYSILDRTWHLLTPEAEEAFFEAQGECALSRGIVHVDLHSCLAPLHFVGSQLAFEEIWQRTVPLSCLGLKIQTLSPEDRLIYLCIHGSKECWRSLKWLLDLAMAIRKSPELDWLAIAHRIDQWHCRRMVLLGLRLVQLQFGLPSLPPEAQPLLQQAQEDRAIATLLAQLGIVPDTLRPLTPRPPTPRSSPAAVPLQTSGSPWQQCRFQWGCLEHWSDRARYARYRLQEVFVPNSQDQAFWSLPPQLSPLYYGLRPLRLLLGK